MKTQAAIHLFQYWNRLRAGLPAPRRTQIEPSDIRDVLSQTFILESIDQRADMQFRVAGTAISNLFGRTLRNTAMRGLFSDAQKPVISRLLRNSYQDHSVVVLGLDATSRSGRNTLLEILVLPLQDEAESHRLLGCIAPHHRQFWHGLEPVTSVNLQSIRVVDPDREPLFLANRPEIALPPSLAPAAEQLHLAPKETGNRGLLLMVIQGGKSASPEPAITKR